MRAPLLLAAALGGSSLVACAVPTPDPGPESASSTATAIVVVERTAGPGDAVRGDAVIARFVRVRQGAVDEPALRMAGIVEDIPAPGTCSAPADNAAVPQTARGVELLDVGQVVLTSEDRVRSTVLMPRSMPDPAGVVSGVFYSSRSTDAFAGGSRIALRSSGGVDLVDGFSVSATAPRDVTDVHVAPVNAGVDVTWEPTTAQDIVYVDVLSPAPHVVVRCATTDTGHLVIPQSAVAGVDEGQIAVHRLHKEAFKAKGIDPGEVRFDVAKVVTFRR